MLVVRSVLFCFGFVTVFCLVLFSFGFFVLFCFLFGGWGLEGGGCPHYMK